MGTYCIEIFNLNMWKEAGWFIPEKLTEKRTCYGSTLVIQAHAYPLTKGLGCLAVWHPLQSFLASIQRSFSGGENPHDFFFLFNKPISGMLFSADLSWELLCLDLSLISVFSTFLFWSLKGLLPWTDSRHVSDRIRRYVDVDKTLPLTNFTSFISSSSARLPTSSDHLFSKSASKL